MFFSPLISVSCFSPPNFCLLFFSPQFLSLVFLPLNFWLLFSPPQFLFPVSPHQFLSRFSPPPNFCLLFSPICFLLSPPHFYLMFLFPFQFRVFSLSFHLSFPLFSVLLPLIIPNFPLFLFCASPPFLFHLSSEYFSSYSTFFFSHSLFICFFFLSLSLSLFLVIHPLIYSLFSQTLSHFDHLQHVFNHCHPHSTRCGFSSSLSLHFSSLILTCSSVDWVSCNSNHVLSECNLQFSYK